MGKIPGIGHLRAVKALEKTGFRIARQGKHIVMTDGVRILTIPRHDPVDAHTMGGIVRDAGLSPEEFRKLL
jgi:predicted RNA binding protein YcfA (HicA-like mRNA interferase family)